MRGLILSIALGCNGDPPKDTDPCTAPLIYAEPGCEPGEEYATIEPGCFTSCAGADDTCEVGACTEAWTNPCICPDSGACCDACGGNQWLCL